MDPNTCLRRIIEAEHDRSEYESACESLAAWLRNGGFKPTIPPGIHFIPGTGTQWALLSPSIYSAKGWMLRRYDHRGKTLESFPLD